MRLPAEVSKRQMKRLARNKAMTIKTQALDDAAAAQAADSDQDPSEGSSGEAMLAHQAYHKLFCAA